MKELEVLFWRVQIILYLIRHNTSRARYKNGRFPKKTTNEMRVHGVIFDVDGSK